MIPLSLGGKPYDDHMGSPGSPWTTLDSPGAHKQSTQMCIKLATLSYPLIHNNTHICHESLKPNHVYEHSIA